MDFGSVGTTKLQYARQLAATLSYLAVQQGDAVGLACIAEDIVQNIPPKRSPAHLSTLFDCLEKAEPRAKRSWQSCCTNWPNESGSELSW